MLPTIERASAASEDDTSQPGLATCWWWRKVGWGGPTKVHPAAAAGAGVLQRVHRCQLVEGGGPVAGRETLPPGQPKLRDLQREHVLYAAPARNLLQQSGTVESMFWKSFQESGYWLCDKIKVGRQVAHHSKLPFSGLAQIWWTY